MGRLEDIRKYGAGRTEKEYDEWISEKWRQEVERAKQQLEKEKRQVEEYKRKIRDLRPRLEKISETFEACDKHFSTSNKNTLYDYMNAGIFYFPGADWMEWVGISGKCEVELSYNRTFACRQKEEPDSHDIMVYNLDGKRGFTGDFELGMYVDNGNRILSFDCVEPGSQLSMMQNFLKEFDGFETDFYALVDSLIENEKTVAQRWMQEMEEPEEELEL